MITQRNPIKRKARIKKFAKTFVETGGNATQAMLSVNPSLTYKSANVEGCKELRKPSTQQEIINLLPDNSEEAMIIKQAYETNRSPIIKWGDLHKYMETSLKIKGILDNKQDKGNTNIAIVLNT